MSKHVSLLEDDDVLRLTGHRIRYNPRGAAQALFHDRSPEILIVGPKGTGKSLAVLHKQHLVMSKYPGARFFMARKTRTSMTNSCLETFQHQVLKPPDRVHFHKQDQQFNYPNGSCYAVVGLDNIDRLNSSNWDGGFIQEATEATERDWEIASACIRFGVMPYKQLIGDCNPDKPSHWLKKRCDRGDVKMLCSLHKDNPRLWSPHDDDWTIEGQQYLARLQKMTGVRYSRLYQGNWTAAEGMIYEKWDPNIHMLSFKDLPADWVEWPQYWSIDFGHTHPFVWQLWVEDPWGRLYLIRQIYHTKMLVEDVADYIMELTKGLPQPRAIICDHDAEGRATLERHTGYLTLPAYKSIQEGVQAVQKRLEPDWDNRPGIFILRDSLVSEDSNLKLEGKPYKTEDEFDGYIWDEKHNKKSDVNSKKDELPVDKDNHGMDACLLGDTVIITSQGNKPLSSIRLGDQVLTRQGFRTVRAAYLTNPKAVVLDVLLSDGRVLSGTGNHPIWVEGYGWKSLDAIRYSAEGSSSVVSTPKQYSALVHVVSVTERVGLHPVYNLTVAEVPEYFANGVLVHNCRYMVAFIDSLADDPQETEDLIVYDDAVKISPY